MNVHKRRRRHRYPRKTDISVLVTACENKAFTNLSLAGKLPDKKLLRSEPNGVTLRVCDTNVAKGSRLSNVVKQRKPADDVWLAHMDYGLARWLIDRCRRIGTAPRVRGRGVAGLAFGKNRLSYGTLSKRNHEEIS
ncbi:hypothetical protein O181_019919 [Austropuccinia psidii MF-1]|uniref:Uncharacterized protein n=1 Tax=Austropuccinia psidii MF-1 TaxID=1389203 RepID=A0A9Q3GV75_9BASI|nr:hypothetical protein [Austropuccinia psidii MF-1]